MRFKIDKENGALYLRLDETAIVESEEVQPAGFKHTTIMVERRAIGSVPYFAP